MVQYFVYWWSKIVLMSLRHADSLSDDPQTLNSSTVHCEDSEAWWRKHRDMGVFLISKRVGPIYRNSMDHFKYIKILKEVMLPYAEADTPLKWVFHKTTTPNTPVSTQHLDPDQQITLLQWPAQSPDRRSNRQLEGWHQKNAVSEAKPRNAEELWYCPGLEIPVHRCQTPCNADVKQFPANHAYTTKC